MNIGVVPQIIGIGLIHVVYYFLYSTLFLQTLDLILLKN